MRALTLTIWILTLTGVFCANGTMKASDTKYPRSPWSRLMNIHADDISPVGSASSLLSDCSNSSAKKAAALFRQATTKTNKYIKRISGVFGGSSDSSGSNSKTDLNAEKRKEVEDKLINYFANVREEEAIVVDLRLSKSVRFTVGLDDDTSSQNSLDSMKSYDSKKSATKKRDPRIRDFDLQRELSLSENPRNLCHMVCAKIRGYIPRGTPTVPVDPDTGFEAESIIPVVVQYTQSNRAGLPPKPSTLQWVASTVMFQPPPPPRRVSSIKKPANYIDCLCRSTAPLCTALSYHATNCASFKTLERFLNKKEMELLKGVNTKPKKQQRVSPAPEPAIVTTLRGLWVPLVSASRGSRVSIRKGLCHCCEPVESEADITDFATRKKSPSPPGSDVVQDSRPPDNNPQHFWQFKLGRSQKVSPNGGTQAQPRQPSVPTPAVVKQNPDSGQAKPRKSSSTTAAVNKHNPDSGQAQPRQSSSTTPAVNKYNPDRGQAQPRQSSSTTPAVNKYNPDRGLDKTPAAARTDVQFEKSKNNCKNGKA